LPWVLRGSGYRRNRQQERGEENSEERGEENSEEVNEAVV